MASLPEGWSIITAGDGTPDESPGEREITEEQVNRLFGLSRGLSFVELFAGEGISNEQLTRMFGSVRDLLNGRRDQSVTGTPEKSA